MLRQLCSLSVSAWAACDSARTGARAGTQVVVARKFIRPSQACIVEAQRKKHYRPPEIPQSLELTQFDLVTGQGQLIVVGTKHIPEIRLLVLTDDRGRRFCPTWPTVSRPSECPCLPMDPIQRLCQPTCAGAARFRCRFCIGAPRSSVWPWNGATKWSKFRPKKCLCLCCRRQVGSVGPTATRRRRDCAATCAAPRW